MVCLFYIGGGLPWVEIQQQVHDDFWEILFLDWLLVAEIEVNLLFNGGELDQNRGGNDGKFFLRRGLSSLFL